MPRPGVQRHPQVGDAEQQEARSARQRRLVGAVDGSASRAALPTSTAPTSAFTGAPPFGSIRPSSVRPFTNSTAPMKNRLTADKGLQRTRPVSAAQAPRGQPQRRSPATAMPCAQCDEVVDRHVLADGVRPVDVRSARTSARACPPRARRWRRRTRSRGRPASAAGRARRWRRAARGRSACRRGVSDGFTSVCQAKRRRVLGEPRVGVAPAPQVRLDLLLHAARPAVCVGLAGQDEHGEHQRRRGPGW